MNLSTATSALKTAKNAAQIAMFATAVTMAAYGWYRIGIDIKECIGEKIDEWTESE